MDKEKLLEQARSLIAEGNTSQALTIVEDFLAGKEQYKFLRQLSIKLAAQFNKAKLDESSSLVSFDTAKIEYAQVNKGLLDLIGYIETDDYNPPMALSDGHPQNKQLNRLVLLIGVPLLVLAVGVLLLVGKIGGKQDGIGENGTPAGEGKPLDEVACRVDFDPVQEKFLVLPFYRFIEANVQPEGLIIERLESFCSKNSLSADFKICEGYKPIVLLDYEEAAKYGEVNSAKVVIWGRVGTEGGKTVIKTRFKYLGSLDTIPFTMLGQGENQVATDSIFSIITSSGELTQDLEATLLQVLGMVAHLEGDSESAIKALQSANVTDTMGNLMKYMILSDNFIRKNEPEEARKALDTCFMTNPNYWLGLHNHANLLIQKGDYQGAINDLDKVLVKQPNNPVVLTSYAVANQLAGKTSKATEIYEKVKRIDPSSATSVDKIRVKMSSKTNLQNIKIDRTKQLSPIQ